MGRIGSGFGIYRDQAGTGTVTGTGTTNTLAKWTSATGIGDSSVVDDGVNVTFSSDIIMDAASADGIFWGTSNVSGTAGGNLTAFASNDLTFNAAADVSFAANAGSIGFSAVGVSKEVNYFVDNGLFNAPVIQAAFNESTGYKLAHEDVFFSSTGNKVELAWDFTNSITFTDTENLKGASYAADYSAANAANPRWIPDKAYVDAAAGTTFYDGDGAIAAATTRTVTIADDSVVTFTAPTFGDIFSMDGDTGKVTINGLLDPIGLQMTPAAANAGDANTLWANSTDSNRPYWGANKFAYFSELTGNGIFDAANDGGTVPTLFDVNLTDSLTIDGGDFALKGASLATEFFFDYSNNQTVVGTGAAVSGKKLTVNGDSHIVGRLGINGNTTQGAQSYQLYVDKDATATRVFSFRNSGAIVSEMDQSGNYIVNAAGSITQIGLGQASVFQTMLGITGTVGYQYTVRVKLSTNEVFNIKSNNANYGVGIKATSTDTSALTIGASTSTQSQIKWTSGADKTTSPLDGDNWYNGTNFYFREGGVNIDLLKGGIYHGSGTVLTSTVATITDTLTFAGGDFALEGASLNVEFFFDYSANKVGIGTTSPTSKLTVDVGAALDGVYVKNSTTELASLRGVSGNAGILALTGNKIFLDSRTNFVSYINNGGKFGVGTASPTSTITANGDVETLGNGNGIIVADATTGTRYRIYVDNGTIESDTV